MTSEYKRQRSERPDCSYVTIGLACGHSIRIARASRPKTRRELLQETAYCFDCHARYSVVNAVGDKEWVVRCTVCRYSERCGTGGQYKAKRRALRHVEYRGHATRYFHENDPEGTEEIFGRREEKPVTVSEGNPGEESPPPF